MTDPASILLQRLLPANNENDDGGGDAMDAGSHTPFFVFGNLELEHVPNLLASLQSSPPPLPLALPLPRPSHPFPFVPDVLSDA